MPKQTNVEDQGDEGAGGTTTPPVSTPPDTPVAVDAKTLSKLVKDAIAEELKPVKGEISGLYSRQDKDRNAFREFMDEFQKQKANNLSDEDAYTATETALKQRNEAQEDKQLLRKIAEKVLGSSSAEDAGNVTSGTAVKAAAELKRYGLNPDEADAIQLQRSVSSLSSEAAEAQINRFILDKLVPPKPANPANVVQSPATRGATTVNVEALNAELVQLSKNPSKNLARINEIGKQLKEAG